MSIAGTERPHVTVATVVQRGDEFLMVEELIDGRRVLNQPAGHWETGESLIDAARRETLEETAWRVEPDSLIGIYSYQPDSLNYSFLRFSFRAKAVEEMEQALDPAIDQALWLTYEEIKARIASHRSPMVLRSIDDALNGVCLPLDLLQDLPGGP